MNFLQPLFGKFSLCSMTGALAGTITGTMLGIVLEGYPVHTLATPDLIRAGIILGLVAWFALLLILGVWLRYGLLAIAPPSFVNALFTSILTTLVSYAVHIPWLCTLIGLLIGLVVGAVLCIFCRRIVREPKSGEGNAAHGH